MLYYPRTTAHEDLTYSIIFLVFYNEYKVTQFSRRKMSKETALALLFDGTETPKSKQVVLQRST